jgi:chromosome segregation ATPase
MDDYPYATLGADRWFRCDGLHRPGFPTLLQDGLHRPGLQKNARLETRIRELNDELMRTYHSRDFKTDDLHDTYTRLQHTQDELTAA